MTKHFSLRFATLALTVCSALSACVIRTAGPYDDCELDPQRCSGAIDCFIDDDCPTGLVCDRVSSTCVATSTCRSSQKCPVATHCDGRQTCVPDGRGTGSGTGGVGGRGGRGGASTGSGGVGGRGGSSNGSGGAVGTGGAGGSAGTGSGGSAGAGGTAGVGIGSTGSGGSVPGCVPGS